MKVWITKYALTEGIFCVDAKLTSQPSMVRYMPANGGMACYVHGNDWHTTAESAKQRAEEMRVKKLQSLEKQIASIKAMTFEVEE